MFKVLAPFSIVLALSACSNNSVCSPGMSIACTGPGGCTGGQACNAGGTGYEACSCGTPDAGTDASSPFDAGSDAGAPLDAGSDAGSDAGPPTHGALHVTWTITMGGSPSTCAAAGSTTVDVIATPMGMPSGAIDQMFACSAGMGDVTHMPFASYVVSISLLDSGGLAITSAMQTVVLDGTACDAVVAGDCVKNVAPTFAF